MNAEALFRVTAWQFVPGGLPLLIVSVVERWIGVTWSGPFVSLFVTLDASAAMARKAKPRAGAGGAR